MEDKFDIYIFRRKQGITTHTAEGHTHTTHITMETASLPGPFTAGHSLSGRERESVQLTVRTMTTVSTVLILPVIL